MSKLVQLKAVKGSQKWLQSLVNQCPEVLNNYLRPKLRLAADDSISWLSPLEQDGYAEYRDQAFLDRLSIRLEKRDLKSFWPGRGPVWDGLGKTGHGEIILVEAKSHATEFASTCKAASPQSQTLIQKTLEETARFYKAAPSADWFHGYYQYANRLAHLYLLRQLNGCPAWLVFIHFMNDSEMQGPKTGNEWQVAIEAAHTHLGFERKQLEPYVIDLFIDVAEVR